MTDHVDACSFKCLSPMHSHHLKLTKEHTMSIFHDKVVMTTAEWWESVTSQADVACLAQNFC